MMFKKQKRFPTDRPYSKKSSNDNKQLSFFFSFFFFFFFALFVYCNFYAMVYGKPYITFLISIMN